MLLKAKGIAGPRLFPGIRFLVVGDDNLEVHIILGCLLQPLKIVRTISYKNDPIRPVVVVVVVVVVVAVVVVVVVEVVEEVEEVEVEVEVEVVVVVVEMKNVPKATWYRTKSWGLANQERSRTCRVSGPARQIPIVHGWDSVKNFSLY